MLDFHIIYFLILFFISEIIHRYSCHKRKYSPVSAGSIVMAIGIFSLAALQKLSFENVFITKLIALELLIIWLYIAASYFICYLKGYFFILVQHMHDQLSIGTWVASCAVMAMVIQEEFPTWHILIWTMALLALAIWTIYFLLLIKIFLKILTGASRIHVGTILLSTVSTQAIVILLNTLLPMLIPRYFNQILIVIGSIFYIIGLLIILRYHIIKKPKYIFIRWSNTNNIIHGALSITGIAILITHAMSKNIIILIWITVTSLFAMIESVSLIKLYQRIKKAGLLKGAFSYDVSQWSRIFTYGMYYAFSLEIFESNVFQNELTNLIAQFGQYVVLVILLIEIAVYFSSKFSRSGFI